MDIAILAHSSKKELMIQFCIAYCGLLNKHRLYSTATTGKLVSEATGLNICQFLSSSQGGADQIASRIAYNEIDVLLFFRDTINFMECIESDMNLLRLCDVHNIPVATNIATAEVIIHGINRGDLDWRKIINPEK